MYRGLGYSIRLHTCTRPGSRLVLQVQVRYFEIVGLHQYKVYLQLRVQVLQYK